MNTSRFASRVFRWGGIYGLAALAPMYLQAPPASGPEFYYGFIGVALAWQAAFLVIAKNPPRYRTIMLGGVLEKTSFSAAVFVLYALGRVGLKMAAAGAVDLALAALFVEAYRRTEAV